jgi:enamine deaminase RidA (YjgF/YER057c/UK114 family)
MSFEIVNPAELGAPRGWNNGLIAPAGARLLFVAGQTGCDPQPSGTVPGFVEQFGRALDKVLAVVAAAGGSPADVARMTVYVTDVETYRASLKPLGDAWKARLGRHYPAMALLEVKGLVDRGAVVEIEATAVLGPA